MARPRKAHLSSDPFVDLAKKAEILEREMDVQRVAIERLKQLRPQSLHVDPAPELSALKRRISR
jgi:hypothetical protein